MEPAVYDGGWLKRDCRLVYEGRYKLKRLSDILIAFAILIFAFIPIIAIAILIKLTSRGPVLYWSERIGKDNRIFRMPKFRSMWPDTPTVATHLLNDPKRCLTPVGNFLRKSSLDELPQLFSILKGDMSFVGPRPALYNQDDLVELRTEKGVHLLIPGMTGWAQVNGRDELSVPVKVQYDAYYLQHRSFLFDLKILLITFQKVFFSEGVRH